MIFWDFWIKYNRLKMFCWCRLLMGSIELLFWFIFIQQCTSRTIEAKSFNESDPCSTLWQTADIAIKMCKNNRHVVFRVLTPTSFCVGHNDYVVPFGWDIKLHKIPSHTLYLNNKDNQLKICLKINCSCLWGIIKKF